MMNVKILFDLDGTVTAKETLPIIAAHFGVQEQIGELTARTVRGDVPFIDSFIQRVQILGKLPVSEIADLLEKTPLYCHLADLIRENKENCAIVTGNVHDWCYKLTNKLQCETFGSQALIVDDKIQKLTRILKKEDVVTAYKKRGYKVVFVGDGNNDVEAMRLADVAIAAGLTHEPAKSVLSVADYAVYNEKTLCRLLNQLF